MAEEFEEEFEERPSARRVGIPSARKGGKLMEIVQRLKKLHPVYWVAGLGGAALLVDYFVEGDQSVASSLYRGAFGGSGGGAVLPAHAARSQVAPHKVAPQLAEGMTPVSYYPAYPAGVQGSPYYERPYYDFRYHGFGHREFGHRGFGHRGFGHGEHHGFGHGGHGGHHAGADSWTW